MAIYSWSIVATGLIFAFNGRAFCPTSVMTSKISNPKVHQHTPLSIIWNVNNDERYQLQTRNNDDRRYQFQLQSIQSRKSTTSILYSSTTSSSSPSSNDKNNGDDVPTKLSTRSKLRQLTGFSMTALRSTLRAATGISLSQTISGILRFVLEILSPSLRYFMQPFLIMYYAPLIFVRYWLLGPNQKYVEESRKGHEKLVEGWRKAVNAAEKADADGYWPVHVNDDGTITTSLQTLPPDPNDLLDLTDLTDGIEKSVAATTVSTNDYASSDTLDAP